MPSSQHAVEKREDKSVDQANKPYVVQAHVTMVLPLKIFVEDKEPKSSHLSNAENDFL